MISIIMPAKNAALFLKSCLDSILSQSFQHWELLAVDDHSSDNTYKILQQYSKADRRIKYLQNKGFGIIEALQTGYQASVGEHVTRMDADDLMPVNKLQVMNESLMRATRPTVVTGKVKYISEGVLGEGFIKYQDWLNLQIDQNKQYQEIYKECVIPSPCWMTTRKSFEYCGGFNSTTYPEDYDLCFRFYQQGLVINGLDKVLHIWRDHELRASKTDRNYAENSFLSLKVKYFKKIDFDPRRQLLLWGAGKKGKKLAALLAQNDIPFIWACNNTNKIGHTTHSHVMQDIDKVFTKEIPMQAIIAIADPGAQQEIKSMLQDKHKIEAFWFS